MTITDYSLPVPMAAIRAHMGISQPFFSAMKKAMGLSGAHLGTVNQFIKFHKSNPHFKYNDVYHRPSCKCDPCQARRERKLQAAAAVSSVVVSESSS